MRTALVLLTLVSTACAKDLRPPAVRHLDEAPADLEDRGRALLQAAADAHGLAAWRDVHTIELDATDVWRVSLFRATMTPLRDDHADVHLRFEAGTGFVAEVTVTSGKGAGERYGVAGTPGVDSYRVIDGVRKPHRGLAAQIYTPSLHYLAELPFRLLEADEVVYVDRVTWQGRPHDRVLASFGPLAPARTHDQYLVYLDAETHHYALARYTIRAAGPMMAGALTFEDLREVDGLWLPFRQVAGFFSEEGVRELHRLEVRSVRPTRLAVDGGAPRVERVADDVEDGLTRP